MPSLQTARRVANAKTNNAKTFGNFELFVNGKPVFFAREKSKEMLAYLIDRRGAVVNKKEIMGILFEDREYDRELQGYFTMKVE